MANIYVRSSDGNNSDNGSTWALAKATLAGAAAIDVAGDTIYLSQAHAESAAAAVNVALASTQANPVRIVCGNDGAAPPTTLADTATVTSTGANGMAFSGAGGPAYIYGISFFVATGNSAVSFTSSLPGALWERCNFRLVTTSASAQVQLHTSSAGKTTLRNCGFRFANASQSLGVTINGVLHLQGGSILSGGTSPTTFCSALSGVRILIDNFDFSNAAAGMNVFSGAVAQIGILRNCKMPASWSGALYSGTPVEGAVFELFNCDDGDTRFRYRKQERYGTIVAASIIERSGGAHDSVNDFSWTCTTGADAEYPCNLLSTPEINAWNDTVGSAITVEVDIVHDSVTALTDKEVWLEVMYLGTSGVPLGSLITDMADYATAAANQTSSSAVWTTTGLTNPNKQKLSVTFTPQEAGWVQAVVKVAKASYTVYVDPMLQIS